MLEVENIEDIDMFGSPSLTRKTSDCLAVTNLTMGSIEFCSTLQLQATFKECRICLDQAEDQQHVFVSPCRCTGSLKFVHHSCFLRWLERQYLSRSLLEQQVLQEEGISCELCKQKVYLGMEVEKKCLRKVDISGRISQNRMAFVVLLLFLAVIGASIGILVYFIQNNRSSFGKDVLGTSVLLCALVFLLIASCFTLYYLIMKYCIQAKNRIKNFSYRRTIRTKNKKKVIPYRD